MMVEFWGRHTDTILRPGVPGFLAAAVQAVRRYRARQAAHRDMLTVHASLQDRWET